MTDIVLFDRLKKMILYKWSVIGAKKLSPKANTTLLAILSEMRLDEKPDYVDLRRSLVMTMAQTSISTRIHPTIFKQSLNELENKEVIERITPENRFLIRLTERAIDTFIKFGGEE